MLNRAGTTFRKLPDKDKTAINANKALSLMLRAAVDDQTARASSFLAANCTWDFPELYSQSSDGLRTRGAVRLRGHPRIICFPTLYPDQNDVAGAIGDGWSAD